jgi:hypothetical protein
MFGLVQRTIVAAALGLVAVVGLPGMAQATLVGCEPDNFAYGTQLTNACSGVTLTAEGAAVGPIYASSFTNFASTGDQVIQSALWTDYDAGEILRGDFAVATDFVSIDAIATFFLLKSAVLSVFDINGILLDSVTLSSTSIMTLSISRASADIAFFRATAGQPGGYVMLDNLEFNVPTAVPEPASLALFAAGLVGAAALRRKRAR